jgi:hypothetical protein
MLTRMAKYTCDLCAESIVIDPHEPPESSGWTTLLGQHICPSHKVAFTIDTAPVPLNTDGSIDMAKLRGDSA